MERGNGSHQQDDRDGYRFHGSNREHGREFDEQHSRDERGRFTGEDDAERDRRDDDRRSTRFDENERFSSQRRFGRDDERDWNRAGEWDEGRPYGDQRAYYEDRGFRDPWRRGPDPRDERGRFTSGRSSRDPYGQRETERGRYWGEYGGEAWGENPRDFEPARPFQRTTGFFGRDAREESHAGKGPKGYQRSEQRLLEDINEALERHPEIDASEIEVKLESGVVVLRGTVEGRHAKRLAEDSVEAVSGVKDVRNELRTQGFGQGGAGRSGQATNEKHSKS